MLNNQDITNDGIEKVAFRPIMNFIKRKPKNTKPKGQPAYNSRPEAYKPKNSEDYKYHDQAKMKNLDFNANKNSGFGLPVDMTLGAVGFIPRVGKKWQENAKNALTKQKIKGKEFDTEMTGKVKDALGVKRGGMIDKFTSKEHKIPIATNNAGEALYRDVRLDSALAPLQNTSKVALPMIGSTVVFDKTVDALSGGENQQEGYEPQYYEEQLANEINLVGIEKNAAIEKIAALENELDELGEIIKVARYEKEILVNDNLKFQDDLDYYKNQYEKLAKEHNELLEKYSSEVKESQKTEKLAKAKILAEKLLERGIIKQAKFDKYINHFVEGDEMVFETLTKIANDFEAGLDFPATLSENESMQPAHPSELAIGKVSSSGQTISEAIADLLD